MEKTYFDFRRQLELMKLNTTCDCDACVNMSALDLKIFIHYGQYLEQQIGTKRDLRVGCNSGPPLDEKYHRPKIWTARLWPPD